jgi:hypothetical protein
MMPSKSRSQACPNFSRRALSRRGSQSAQRDAQSGVCVLAFPQRISGLWLYFTHFWQLNFIFNIARARCSREATVPGEHSNSAAASA